MPLAEGISALVRYKFYASGAITPGVEEVLSSAPGTSGGQALRRTSCTLDLSKDTFESEEFRADRQVVDMRHGTRRVSGDIAGEFSPSTYRDFFQALFRGTWVMPATAITNTQTTSVAADNATSTFTFASGDLHALGVRVGQIVRFASMTQAGNDATNFLVLSMTGTSGRILGVYPAPVTQTADVTFTMTIVGGRLSPPASAPVSRKLAVEVYHEDLDLSRVFTECRVNSGAVTIPPNAIATCTFGLTGRNMQVLTGAAAPYLTAPTAETSTGLIAGSSGALVVNGTVVGVVTGFELNIETAPESEPVIGQNFVPEIFLGKFKASGQLTAYFESATLLNLFLNETESSVVVYATTGSGIANDAVVIAMNRVKFGGGNLPTQGEGAQTITMPFVALKHPGGVGIDAATLSIFDTTVLT